MKANLIFDLMHKYVVFSNRKSHVEQREVLSVQTKHQGVDTSLWMDRMPPGILQLLGLRTDWQPI